MTYTLKDLKALVKSMSKAEKKYFSQLQSAFTSSTEPPFYLQLFHSLSKQNTELPKFHADASAQVLTTAKKRLFKNVMKGLRAFHQETSVDITIQNHLSEIEILYNHSLPEQSFYVLQKAYRLAVSYEKFGLLLQILEWEGKLNIIMDHALRKIEVIAEEEQEVLEKLKQIMHLENIYNITKNMKKEHGYIKEWKERELKQKTIDALKMITYEQCKSKKARFYFNFIHALYYWMTFDHGKAYQYSKRLLHPEMEIIALNDYISGILEHVASCVNFGLFHEAFTALNLAGTHIRNHRLSELHALHVKIFYYEASFQLIIYNYMGDAERLTKTLEATEEKLVLYEERLSIEMKQVLYGNMMNAYLGIGNNEKVEETWEKMFNGISNTVRHDINGDLHLFKLFKLLQDEVYAVLPSIALSAHRYYNKAEKQGLFFNVELRITTLILKQDNFENPEARRQLLVEMKQIFLDYIAGLKETNNFQEHYSRYLIWIDSILSKRPFHEEATLWYRQYQAHLPERVERLSRNSSSQ